MERIMTIEERLHARPKSITAPAPAGLRPLGIRAERDSYLYVPAGYGAAQPSALMLLLHGAGGHAHHGIELFRHLADDAGLIIVAPASHGGTWDAIQGSYGPDVATIDRSLEHVFSHYAIDEAHLAIGGFSDGASYALSLGLSNGDLFTHVIALSPGFIAPMAAHGKPRIFVSHGIGDDVLPIEWCSRKIVPQLKRGGYEVVYREFDGGHIIPADVPVQAVDWFLA
jgi:phospholipase/carboxylesterase